MNIFVLDRDPDIAAKYHCDKHVNKMIIESCQLLSTAIRQHYDDDFLYNFTRPWEAMQNYNPNGRFVQWLLESKENMSWLSRLAGRLCVEFVHRNGKSHGVAPRLVGVNRVPLRSFPDVPMTPFRYAVSTPIFDDPVLTYRYYYVHHKRHIKIWAQSEPPIWWLDDDDLENMPEDQQILHLLQ